MLGLGEKRFDEPCVMGEESIMSPKAHGTSSTPVQETLRWDCDRKVADNICNFNRYVKIPSFFIRQRVPLNYTVDRYF
jgi:hypothetical protein